jgi:hypothetical protein
MVEDVTMRHRCWLPLVLGTAVLALAYRVGKPGEEKQRAKAPPLSLEGLLDEKLPEPPRKKVRVKVDNGACYVCHANYETESLVVSHGKEEIGCVDCHGQSAEHRNDEDNITPPDIMYPQDQIDKMCSQCHETHNAPGRNVVGRWLQRCPEKANPDDLICTDCHYEHRLSTRVVRWDKKTRALLLRNVVSAGRQADAPKSQSGEKPGTSADPR